MKRVAIWGAYWQGNFGDDLMAVMIAREVRACGADPVLYRLNAGLAERHGLEVADSIERLLAGASVVVLGGGAVLHDYGNDECSLALGRLVDAAEDSGVPMIAVSVGSHGATTRFPEESSIHRLLTSSRFLGGTVRLASDVSLLALYGVHAVYFPDMVLCARCTSSRPSPSPRRTVGLSIPRRSKMALFGRCVEKMYRMFGIRTLWIDRFRAGRERGACYEGKLYYKYDDPFELIEQLQALQGVLSTGLHVGLAAWCVGCPFVALAPSGKTRAVLREAGAERWVVPTSRRVGNLFRFFRCAFLMGRSAVPVPARVEQWKKDAEGHLEWLAEYLRRSLGGG